MAAKSAPKHFVRERQIGSPTLPRPIVKTEAEAEAFITEHGIEFGLVIPVIGREGEVKCFTVMEDIPYTNESEAS